MREIKFRAWDKENKCWWQNVYKAYAGELAELHISLKGDLSLRTIDKMIHESLFPDRFALMQFTGLHDKNGKEICEGDIVKYPSVYHEELQKGEVVYESGMFTIKGIICWVSGTFEVIGNIYENPELL